ncbi:MAG TPA: DUF4126 family protein, partial [Flavisolibacter sp.]
AGTIQLGTGLLRLFSSKATVGTGNAVVATGENAVAVTGSVLSFIAPVIIALLLIALITWILLKIIRRFSGANRRREERDV